MPGLCFFVGVSLMKWGAVGWSRRVSGACVRPNPHEWRRVLVVANAEGECVSRRQSACAGTPPGCLVGDYFFSFCWFWAFNASRTGLKRFQVSSKMSGGGSRGSDGLKKRIPAA